MVAVLSGLSGQTKEWSFKECLSRAIYKNIDVNQSRLNCGLNEINYAQSVANFFPTLNASDAQAFNFGRTLDPFTYQFTNQNFATNNASLNANAVVFNGFLYLNTIRQNRFFYDASILDVERIKNDLTLNVMTAYLQVLFNYEAVQIAQKQAEATLEQVERTSKYVNAGKLPESNLLQIQAQLSSDKLAIVMAGNQLQLAKVVLLQLMETPVYSGFEIERPDISNLSPSALLNPAEIYKTAEGIMPQVMGAAFNTEAALTGTKIAKSLYLPKLSLGASLRSGYSSNSSRLNYYSGYQLGSIGFLQNNPAEQVIGPVPVNGVIRNNYPMSDQFSDNFGQVISLNLSIPIFNNFQARYAMQKAKINVALSTQSEQAVKNNLRKSIEQAYTDLVGSGNKYLAAEEELSSEERAYKDMEKKYALGLSSSVDYLIEKNNFLKAEQSVLQSKYDYLFKIKVIDFYMGKPVSF
jgi:outer membrane protein